MPKISVIILVYNVEMLIERCARSLFEQTLDDMEFVFVNDCTPDRSMQILRSVLMEYPNRLSQTKIINLSRNSGQAAARVKGLLSVSGEYVIHCDSDDWVSPHMYSTLYNIAKQNNSDCVICDFFISDGYSHSRIKERRTTCLLDSFFKHKISSSLWNKLYKRNLLDVRKMVSPLGNMGEDTLINMQFALNAKSISYVDEALYFYYQNENSITNSLDKSSAISRFRESVKNVRQIELWAEREGIISKYATDILTIKSEKRTWLIPFINDNECYRLWKNSFPGLNKKIILSKEFTLKTKFKVIFAYFKIPYTLFHARKT